MILSCLMKQLQASTLTDCKSASLQSSCVMPMSVEWNSHSVLKVVWVCCRNLLRLHIEVRFVFVLISIFPL